MQSVPKSHSCETAKILIMIGGAFFVLGELKRTRSIFKNRDASDTGFSGYPVRPVPDIRSDFMLNIEMSFKI
jgi:hypothetical protein